MDTNKIELLQEYTAYITPGYAKSTVESYTGNTKKFLQHIDDPITADTKTCIDAYTKTITPYTNAETRFLMRKSISNFFKYLIAVGYREDNPILNTPTIQPPKRQPVTLTPEQVKFLLDKPGDTALNRRNHAMILMMMDCGLRVNEVCTLQLSDVLEEDVRIIGKGDKERVIPLSSRVRKALEAWLDRRWTLNPKSDYMFITVNGGPVSTDIVQKFVREHCNSHPHALRVYFASRMINAGVSVYIVSKLLGHTDVKTTERYIDLDHNAKRRAIREVIG